MRHRFAKVVQEVGIGQIDQRFGPIRFGAGRRRNSVDDRKIDPFRAERGRKREIKRLHRRRALRGDLEPASRRVAGGIEQPINSVATDLQGTFGVGKARHIAEAVRSCTQLPANCAAVVGRERRGVEPD